MALLLLFFIYIAFIGLGLPDSLFGSAWPAIYEEFNIPISFSNFITTLIAFGTIASSLLSAKLIKKFGTGIIAVVSTLLTAIAILGFSLTNSFWLLCLLCIPLGFGAGSIDVALNNYVALNYKATHMNFLHCFYGVGISLSPFLMSLALSNSGNWRGGYSFVFYIQIGISVLMFIALPFWKKVAKKREEKLVETQCIDTSQKEEKPEKLKGISKLPFVKITWIILFSSVALEFTCGYWGSSFFVYTKGFSKDLAALVITFYYIGMTVGRFLSGILSAKLKPITIIDIGQSILLVALILIVLPLPPIFGIIGIAMIGLGNGPLFPNVTYMTPILFGREKSSAVMGTQYTACHIGLTIMPLIFGFLAEINVNIFPFFLFGLYAILITFVILFNVKLQKERKNGNNLL